MEISICEHCHKKAFWYERNLIIPDIGGVSLPNSDLPEAIIVDYNEARSILSRSPRGASAILRLAIQKLCKHLGEKGKNIDDDIAELVKKGLPVKVQQALDILRVVGNNAVHPGVIDFNDEPELATKLFGLINIIAEDRITRPKEVELMFNKLPENSRKAIEKRDNK